MFGTSWVHFQGEGCICSTVRCTRIGVASLVDRTERRMFEHCRISPNHQTGHTNACKTYHTTVSLRMNPRGSKHVRDNRN